MTVKNNIINFRFRDFSYDNINSYLSNIDAEFQLFDGYNGDANIHAENVSIFLKSLQNKYFPIKSKTMSTKRIKIPWLTSEIMKCIDKKHRWHRMVKFKIITFASYKKYCSIVRNILKTAEKEYNSKKLMKLGSDMRKNWIMLNKLMGKSKKKISDNFIIGDDHCTDAATISEAFNEYFIDHPQNIQSTIGNSAGNYYNLIDDSLDSMYFGECEVVEVSKEISKLKKRGKVDDISGKFLKLSNEKVSPIICDYLTTAFYNGFFQNVLKLPP